MKMNSKPKHWSENEWAEFKQVRREAGATKPGQPGVYGGKVEIDFYGKDEDGRPLFAVGAPIDEPEGWVSPEEILEAELKAGQIAAGGVPSKVRMLNERQVSKWLKGLPMPSMKKERSWRIINVILENGWVGMPPMNNLNNWKIYTDRKDIIGVDKTTGKQVFKTYVVWKEKAISKIPEEVKASGLYMVKKYDRMYPAWKVKK